MSSSAAEAHEALSPSAEPQLPEASNKKEKRHNTTDKNQTFQNTADASSSSLSTQHDSKGPSPPVSELQLFLDSSNSCIFGVDSSGKINLWNTKMSEVSGFHKDQVLNQSLVSSKFLSSPEQQQLVSNLLKSAMKGEATSDVQVEMMIVKKKGDGDDIVRQPFSWDLSPQRNQSGSIVGAICMAKVLVVAASKTASIPDVNSGDPIIASDNTTSHQTERMMQLVFENANTLFFGIGSDGKINEWNQKMAQITEITREEAIRQPFETLVLPKFQSNVKDLLQQALLEGKETSNFELEFETKSNKLRHLLLNTTPLRKGNHQNGPAVQGVLVFAQDVTDVLASHDRASMSRELRQLVETANAPIFGIDVNGNVNEWNDKTAEITGFTKAEALHQPLVSTFIVPNFRESVQEVLDAALQGNETSNYQLEFRTKTNETRYLLVNASTRRDIDSNIVGVVGVAQDVTDDRKHSEALRQMQFLRASQEAKLETERNMTAYFAHELRNPLHAIDSALKLMPDMPLTAESTELVNSMTQCASFMSSIMNNLLDVRKMEEGKMVLNKMPLSLTGLMERVRTMLLPSVRSGVTFLTHCHLGEKDWVMGDSHRIQQVLTNVITNAIKYTTTGGSIVVTVSAKDDLVRFECKDTGPGIPKQDQNKLFQRFVQRGGAPGTGLGLAIAKHLVDLTGGQIFFESDPASRPGTTCVIEMPLQSCPEPSNDDGTEESAFIEQPIRLLIIDDIRMNRTMFRRRVIKGIAPKAKIKEASTGEEALETCKHEGFDVILVDQHMEEAGGVLLGTDTVVAMRRRGIDSVIVGCSGNDIDDQFMESGTDWVMKKPTPPNDVIVKRLRQLLARRQRILERSTSTGSSNSNSLGNPSSSSNAGNNNGYQSVSSGMAAPLSAPYVTDFSTSEAVKRRLGLTVCPSFGPPVRKFKKRKIV